MRSSLQCDCQSHVVKLKIESRNSQVVRRRDLSESFHVIFTDTANTPAWKEAEIRVVEDSLPEMDTPQEEPRSPPLSTVKPKRRVRFGMIKLHLMRASPQQKLQVPDAHCRMPTAADSGQYLQLQKIQDLCTAIARLPL